MSSKTAVFTEGKILEPLLKFMLPVLAALFLQAMYGAVDLLVVGQFAANTDVSAVSTGSQLLQVITNLITSFSMGITVTIGQQLGSGRPQDAGRTVGTGIAMFSVIGIMMTVAIAFGSGSLAALMNAPAEAFEATKMYICICGIGTLIIIAYNLIGSIFRGLGDSKTPLLAVGIACLFNVLGDLLFVAVFGLGAAGAAIATVLAQLISVIVSFVLIRRKALPFNFERAYIKLARNSLVRIVRVGGPIAVQDFLVSVSFLVILAIVNSLGVTASAGVGVAEKVCAFIMLVPSAFMQSMSAFVAQNIGAGKFGRALKTLRYGIITSFCFGTAMCMATLLWGDKMSAIFTHDQPVIMAAFDYLKAYSIDCILTCFLFCLVGFFNGMGSTTLVMVQGIIGAFCVRIPAAYLMSRWEPVSLFHIGLSTPMSSVIQNMILLFALLWVKKHYMDKKISNKGNESLQDAD